MKRFFLIILFGISISLSAQQTCTGFNVGIDFNHYKVSAKNDSTFVKYIQFDLSDTSSISKISYTLSNLTTGSQTQHDYNFNSMSSAQNLVVANNCARNKKHVKISLGYFTYSETNYLLNIKLYDRNNNLIDDTNFNFSH